MKKKILVLSVLGLLSAASVAACSLTSLSGDSLQSDASALLAGGMKNEAVSASLLFAPTTAQAPQLKKAWGGTGGHHGWTNDDPASIASAISGFDNLVMDDYTIVATEKESDRPEYAKEVILTYTLPDASKSDIALYYNEVTTTTGDNDTSSTEDASSSSEEIPASSEVTSSTDDVVSSTSEDVTSVSEIPSNANHESDYFKALHSGGYKSGFCNGMLHGANRYLGDQDGETTVEIYRVTGLAVYDTGVATFAAENKIVTKGNVTLNFASFGLFNSWTDFLAVEKAFITDGTDTRSVYVYSAYQNGAYTHLLLQSTPDSERYVYFTSTEKDVINRFTKNGTEYYELFLAKEGNPTTVGLFKKVVTTAEDGTETITYERASYREIGRSASYED